MQIVGFHDDLSPLPRIVFLLGFLGLVNMRHAISWFHQSQISISTLPEWLSVPRVLAATELLSRAGASSPRDEEGTATASRTYYVLGIPTQR